MDSMGFDLRQTANWEALVQEVLTNSIIEGEQLPAPEVRSSLARQLGIDYAGVAVKDRRVDSTVAIMLDATKRWQDPLDKARMFRWQAALFPDGRNYAGPIITNSWRNDADGPMKVTSGAFGKEKVHFEAPAATLLEDEMRVFLNWVNEEQGLDLLMKAGVAHLWFITIHPFEDGNGRVARTLSDYIMAKSDGSDMRFYSLSSAIQDRKAEYYEQLEKTQLGSMDITNWMLWFLDVVNDAFCQASKTLEKVLYRAKFWQQYSSHAFNERQVKMLNKLMDGIEGKLNSSKWAKMTKCSTDTALRDITQLLNVGALLKEEGGGRSTSYCLTSVV
jgi:Fic family protein